MRCTLCYSFPSMSNPTYKFNSKTNKQNPSLTSFDRSACRLIFGQLVFPTALVFPHLPICSNFSCIVFQLIKLNFFLFGCFQLKHLGVSTCLLQIVVAYKFESLMNGVWTGLLRGSGQTSGENQRTLSLVENGDILLTYEKLSVVANSTQYIGSSAHHQSCLALYTKCGIAYFSRIGKLLCVPSRSLLISVRLCR